MRWRSALAYFVGLLSLTVGAIALLHRLGAASWARIPWQDLPSWLRFSHPADAIAALLRLVALGVAYWLLATALLYAAARLTRLPGAVATAGRVTPPMIRRLADRAIVLVMVASTAAGGARAVAQTTPTPPPVVIPAGDAGIPEPKIPGPELVPAGEGSAEGVLPRETSPAPGHPQTTPTGGLPSLAADAAGSGPDANAELQVEGGGRSSESPPPVEVRGHHVVVEHGDNLWNIARAHLAGATGAQQADLTDGAIHQYWVRVIESNRGSLRSGHPNLIYPGERIALPPVR